MTTQFAARLEGPNFENRILVDSPAASLFPLHKPEGTEATLSDSQAETFPDQPEDVIIHRKGSTGYFKVDPKMYTKTRHGKEATLDGSDPTCLPPITATRSRTLVLCFDGTGDQFDNDNSNIVHIMSMLKKDDRNVQMCYYQAGIGTYTGRHFTLPGAKTVSEKLDAAVAWALEAHVQEGYEFLMQNYVAGDKVCLFGFSRGAYTARALAGMLHKVGLLPRDNKQQVLFAWKMYNDVSDNGWILSRQFKKAFCVDVTIDFIGVFDTVSSVGVFGKKLPFTASNFGIRVFRHAMALDERRARFKVNHWTWTKAKDEKHTKKGKKSVRKGHEHEWKEADDVVTDVKEVWFSGCHCDVGGGSVKNEEPHCLARIPLRWMVREAFRCKTGILWDIDGLKSIGLDPECLYPEVIVPSPLSRTHTQGKGSQMSGIDNAGPSSVDSTSKSDGETDTGDKHDDPDRPDAVSPIFDQLSLAPTWWVLELFPTKGRKQLPPPRDFNEWKSYYFVNVGKGRVIPRSNKETHFHRSVKTRLESINYKWKATGSVEPVWVD